MSLKEYNFEEEMTDMSFVEELLIKYWKLRFKPCCVRGLIHCQLKKYYIEEINKNPNNLEHSLRLAKILLVQDEDSEALKILE